MNLRFRYHLISYYLIITALSACAAIFYIFQQKKELSVNALQNELESCNDEIYRQFKQGIRFSGMSVPDDIRVTATDTAFWIVYDSKDFEHVFSDNLARAEGFIQARKEGESLSLNYSMSMDDECLNYVRKYPELYIRTSAPFSIDNIAALTSDKKHIYIIIALVAVLILTLIFIARKLTQPLKAFNEFFEMMKSGNHDFSKIRFPHDEYGEVGQKIVDTFDQLEQTKLYKQQMSHNIAHELKTPVTGIRAYLETILEDESMDPAQMRRFVDKAHKQSLRLTSLINDVSTLNKLNENSSHFKIEEVNIAECIREVEEELSYRLKAANISLHLLISSEISLRGCHQLIYSLFKNLIDNTIEHAGPNVSITIKAGISQKNGEGSNYRIFFTYEDNGKGVPEASIGRLFERFYRIEQGRTRKTGGSGLGLAIVKNAVLFHKGTISAGNAPGGGIIFKFNLMSLN